MPDCADVEEQVQSADTGAIRWGLGTALGSLALAFVVYILGDTVLVFAAPGLYNKHQLLFSIVAYQFLGVGVASCVVWLVVNRAHGRVPALGFRIPTWAALFTAAFSLIPIFIGVTLLTAAFATFFPSYHIQGNAKQELPVGTHVSLLKALAILVWAALEAPLVEETLFRGIIFQGALAFFRRRMNHHLAVLLGALVSGSLFGLAHFEPHTLPILIFLGIALAYVFHYAKSIYASMLVHGTVNAIAAISVMHGG